MSVFSFENINPGNNSPQLNNEDEKKHLFTSIFMPLVFLALMWVSKLFEIVTGYDLSKYGIYPRHASGLPGIIASPFIHGDLNHIVSNSVPFFILGFLMIYNYRKVAFKAFLFIYLMSDTMVWIIGRESYHIGASNLVYGFAFFIFFSGIFRKNVQSIALSLLIIFLYGQIIWGLFPLDWQISWEGHLMGGIAGAFIAYVYRKVDLPPAVVLDEDDDEDETDSEFLFPTDEIKINYELKKLADKK